MGATGFSRTGPFDAYSMVSTFPFVNDLRDLKEFGPDVDFDPSDAPRYAALILAQEIGVMLPRYGAVWNNPSCVMFPALPGRMRVHLEALNPDECPIGSERATTPGTAQVQYNRQLLRDIGG